jgi:hypothetical protein
VSAIEDLEPNDEPLDEAGSLILQLVAAVDYLRRGVRPGFTVWDAFEEGLRWHAGIDEDWTVADPLGRAIRLSFASTGDQVAAETLNIAVRHWVEAVSGVYNCSLPWE